MRDVVEFASPFGVVGRLVDSVVLTRYLTTLIAHRNEAIKRAAEAASCGVRRSNGSET